MTEDLVLDTTIDEPSMTAGEAEMLLFALERSRMEGLVGEDPPQP